MCKAAATLKVQENWFWGKAKLGRAFMCTVALKKGLVGVTMASILSGLCQY